MIGAKYRFYGTHAVNLFPSLSSSWVSEWVGAVTYEQALLFGRAKRVSRLRANEWWSREGPRTPFLHPSLARSREARFARLNRRACSQAIGAAAGWCNNRELTMETFSGRRQLQPDVTSWFVQYCACSCSPHCRRAPVGDVKLVCLALWREREYLTFISIRFVAFSNQNFADYRF